MIKILYGTGNAGKLAVMRRSLKALPVEITDLSELLLYGKQDKELPEIEEAGSTPLENARIKALAYYEALRIPVFSCDTGLYMKELPKELQPGVHVRNIGGKRLTDEEMTEYYRKLALRYGELTARYQNGICLVLDETHIYESMDDDLSGIPFLLTAEPYPKRQPGFPLDCLSKDIKTGKYFYEMGGNQEDTVALDRGYFHFFKRSLKDAGLL